MAKTTKALTEKIEKYLELKAQADAITEQADAIKEELKALAAAEESRTLTAGTHSVTLSEASRSTINAKEFAAAHPRLAAKFTKVTTYTTVKIK